MLHLALTNDEGWRLEIPGLEELKSVGSKRCFGECSISFLPSFDTFSITSKLINLNMTLSFGFARSKQGSLPFDLAWKCPDPNEQQYYR